MTCPRCNKEISFNQWYSEPCPKQTYGTDGMHTAYQDDIRKAYATMLTEAAYSRGQP